MIRAKVLIPFHRRETDTDQIPGDEILVSEDELARIRRVNVNMVLAIGVETEPEAEPEAEAEVKPKPKKKKQ